jgi:uncharacterized protein
LSTDIQNRLRSLKALQPRRPRRAPREASPLNENAENHERDWVRAPTRAAIREMAPETPQGSAQLAEMLGATVQRNHYGEHLVCRRWFPVAGESDLRLESLHLLDPDAPPEASDPAQWLFLDTETTGIVGGTGTYAFLVGVGWWDAGGIQVEQFFMRDYDEEHAVLKALAERLAERRVLVTFNGKTFDWPLLETRFRLTRSITPRKPRAHLDLLHPARALWRPRLGSVRLVELERKVLGIDRGSDLFSEFIPQIYFDFVRGGLPHGLVSVVRHNQMDLVGLAALAARIFALVADAESADIHALDVYGLSRLLDRRGHAARARKMYERALDGGLPDDAGRSARHQLARLAKRDGDFPLANSLWEKLCSESREGLMAYEQLAIYYEHRTRQPARAATLIREALVSLRNARRAGTVPPAFYRRFSARLEHRLARLAVKSENSLLLETEA